MEKKRIKTNIIDILIIAVLVAAIVLAALVYSPWELIDRIGGSGEDVTYTVEICGVDRAIATAVAADVKEGQAVTEGASKKLLGVVAGPIEISNHEQVRYDKESGSTEMVSDPALADMIIVISVNAERDESRGYSIDGLRLAVGAEYELTLPNYSAKGCCISIIVDGGQTK